MGRSFALLPNVKCTIYLFQTTLEGNQYNNSYFWYKKKLEHTIDLELVCFGIITICELPRVFQKQDFHLQFSFVVFVDVVFRPLKSRLL